MDEGGVLEMHDDHNYRENHGNVHYLNCSSPIPSEVAIPVAVCVCDGAESTTHTDSASDSEVDYSDASNARSLTSNPSEFSKFVSFDLSVVPYKTNASVRLY